MAYISLSPEDLAGKARKIYELFPRHTHRWRSILSFPSEVASFDSIHVENPKDSALRSPGTACSTTFLLLSYEWFALGHLNQKKGVPTKARADWLGFNKELKLPEMIDRTILVFEQGQDEPKFLS